MMILLISILLLYLSLMNLYFYNKERRKSLKFKKWSQYFLSLFFIFIFIFIFLIFLRILNFFRATNTLDLIYIKDNYNFFMLFIFFLFLLSFKRLVFFFFKLSFLKLHYFYLAPENNNYCIFYYKFYVNIIHKTCRRIYKYFFFIDKFMLFMLILFFMKDINYNDFILNETLFFLKFYGLFKIIYLIVKFISTKQDLMLDYFLFNLYYQDSISIDEGFFAENLSKKYKEITYYEKNVLKV